MNKNIENVKITANISPKSDNIIRRHAFNEKITLGEMIEKCLNSHLEIMDFEKGKNHCYKCQAKIKKFEDVKGILCQGCIK